MTQGGESEGLHVVRGDVVPAGEPGPGAGGGEQGGGASGRDPERERGGFTRGTADIDDIAGDLGGDRDLGDGGPGGFELGGARDGADAGGLQVTGVEALGVTGEDLDLVRA